jgi:hypothetical protein
LEEGREGAIGIKVSGRYIESYPGGGGGGGEEGGSGKKKDLGSHRPEIIKTRSILK